MELRKLISRFIANICEKNYSQSNLDLAQIIEAKIKNKVSSLVEEKSSPAQKAAKEKFLKMVKSKKKGSSKKTNDESDKKTKGSSDKKKDFLKMIKSKKTSKSGNKKR